MVTDLTDKTLAGRYQFEAKIGEGTFAQVYRVHDTRRSVDLAAKVLRTDIAHEVNFIQRFRREADVLARLQHPNIVRYYDLVEAEGYVFILMEYVPGQTLQSTLYRLGQPLKPREVMEFLRPLTAALHFAHNEGVIHRDLKPANVLMHTNGNLLVTDFGIARFLDDAAMSLTGGRALGTPLYMAPEQITGSVVQAQTDIYALGVILYQMLAQRVPFDGTHPEAKGETTSERVTYEHLHIEPPQLSQVVPEVDESVEVIVMACLEKDPEHRPDTVRAVYDDWAEAVGAVPVDLNAGSQDAVGPPDVKLPELSQFDLNLQEERDNKETVLPPPSQSRDTVETTPVPSQEPDKTIKSTPYPEAAPGAGVQVPRPVAPAPTPQPPVYNDIPERPAFDPMRFLLIGVALAMLACIALGIYTFVPFGDENDEPTATALSTAVNATDQGNNESPPLDLGQETPDVELGGLGPSGISDGSKIAFAARISGPLGIYVSDINGNNPRRLVSDTSVEQQGPAWSPDGSRIAFYGWEGDSLNPADIYIVNADGSGLRNVTNSSEYNDRYVSWSPDGESLVFHSTRPGEDGSQDFEIWRLDLDTFELTQLTKNGVSDLGPDWSPDGEHIAYFSFVNDNAVIYTMQTNGANIQRISPETLPGGASYPSWSPDGSQIAFHVQMDPRVFQVYIMDADGSNARPLMDVYSNDQFPDWSADGQSIIFQRVENDVRTMFRYSLVDGTLTEIREGYLPDWQPVY